MSGEFERQFYGDVMLFSVDRLTSAGGLCTRAGADFAQTLDKVHGEMLARYNARQQAILHKLARLDAWLADPSYWWHDAAAGFRQFAANVRRNFGASSSGHARINDTAHWISWRARLLDALEHYAEDRAAWSRLI